MRVGGLVVVVVVTILGVGVAGCGGGGEDEAGGQVTVQLQEVNGSGQTGTVTLTPAENDSTHVLVELSPAEGANPAYIHDVTCAEFAEITGVNAQHETVQDTLRDLQDGRSETTLGLVTIEERATGSYSITLHEPSESFPAVACGDIPAQD